MTLPMSTRYEINALIEDLWGDGETFPAASARRLVELLPLTRRSWFSASGSYESSGPSSTGYSPGVGDVRTEPEKKTKEFATGDNRLRIGGYKLDHRPGRIDISLMWEDAPDRDGSVARLFYRRSSGAPTELQLGTPVWTRIGPLRFGRMRFDFWKRPV